MLIASGAAATTVGAEPKDSKENAGSTVYLVEGLNARGNGTACAGADVDRGCAAWGKGNGDAVLTGVCGWSPGLMKARGALLWGAVDAVLAWLGTCAVG